MVPLKKETTFIVAVVHRRITKVSCPVQMEQSSMLKYSGTPRWHKDILTYIALPQN